MRIHAPQTCADKLSHRTVVPWAGASVAVTVCGPHLSRPASVVELTPLACCGDTFSSYVGMPALRFELDGQVAAMDAAVLVDGPFAGSLLLAVACAGVGFSARLLTAAADGTITVAWLRESCYTGTFPWQPWNPPPLRVCPLNGDVVVAFDTSLLRWQVCSATTVAVSRTRNLKMIVGLILFLGDVVFVAGRDSRGPRMLLLSMPEDAPAVELRLPGGPILARDACTAALGAIAVSTISDDIELFHALSGRYLGRVYKYLAGPRRFTSVRTCVAPASAAGGGASCGLVSWCLKGERLLLHPPQRGGARDACRVGPPAEPDDRPTGVTQRTGWCRTTD